MSVRELIRGAVLALTTTFGIQIHRRKLSLGVMLAAGLFSGCKPSTQEMDMRTRAQEVLAIRPASNLSKADAEKIMEFYFIHNISGCGGPGDLVDEGEYWSSVPRIGIAGSSAKDPVRLQKASGRIAWASGPSYGSLQALVKAARTGL